MTFFEERAAFETELDTCYRQYPRDFSALEEKLHAESARHLERSSYQRKMLGYKHIARACPVHIFRHSPFYFEFNTGATRDDLGTGGIGGWLKRDGINPTLHQSSVDWWRLSAKSGLAVGWAVVDDSHHTIGYDHVLRLGLNGLIQQAEQALEIAETESQREFLRASIAGNQAVIQIAERMGAQAQKMADAESDPFLRARLLRIAETAPRVPAEPPQTFYEALNTLMFMFRVLQNLEGNGVSILGHLDRMLFPYYQRDLANGVVSLAEAHDLIRYFLAIPDTRFDIRNPNPDHVGTNTAIALAGCDADGHLVYNSLTRLVLETHLELRLVDPKINLRLSSQHPDELFDVISRFIAGGGNSLALYNDPVIIEANVRRGKKRRDCNLYVGGGCQENVLENCEVNSRATIYMNLLNIFLAGFFPEIIGDFTRREQLEIARYEGCPDFESFYQTFVDNFEKIHNVHVRERNRTEAAGSVYNPCPAHASTLDDCLAQGRDMFAGGARYNPGSISLTGIGTLIDSLFAVQVAVFQQGRLRLAELQKILATDFQTAEPLRQWLANRVPKFGHSDLEIRQFSARVFADLAARASGLPNSRGGTYEASLFSFRSFVSFAKQTGATPDGRHAGDLLSAGMGPSLLALGPQTSTGSLLRALEPLDLRNYPVAAVLDMKIPRVPVAKSAQIIGPVVRRFLDSGGSVLQINCVNQQILLEARENPARHPDLIVRISGYSSYFNKLSPEIQDEVIERAVAE